MAALEWLSYLVGEVLDGLDGFSRLEVCGEAAGGPLLYGTAALWRGAIQGVENVARTARAAQRGVELGKVDLRQDVHLVEGPYGAVAPFDKDRALPSFPREAP